MKGRVLTFIIIAALGIGILTYYDILGSQKTVVVKAHYMQYACGDDNIDMNVIDVSDTTFSDLVGKDISPESRMFTQNRLVDFVDKRTIAWQNGTVKTKDYILVGYIRKSLRRHCSGAVCFKVKEVKLDSENEFTRF